MRKLMVAIGCCMLCLMFMGCPGQQFPFWFHFKNKSSDPITVIANTSRYRYPDTSSLNLFYDPLDINTVSPNSNGVIYGYTILSEHYAEVFSDTMPIYIFLDYKSPRNAWEADAASGRVLQRYDLSYKDIESLGFVIPYPPTEAMRDMKMWPRYKSVVK